MQVIFGKTNYNNALCSTMLTQKGMLMLASQRQRTDIHILMPYDGLSYTNHHDQPSCALCCTGEQYGAQQHQIATATFAASTPPQ